MTDLGLTKTYIDAKNEGRLEALKEIHNELLTLWEYAKKDANRPQPDYLTACAVVGLWMEKEAHND